MCKKFADCISVPLTPRETVLGCIACGCAAAACLMTGLVIGMLISPRKNVAIGSHNGNTEDYRTITETPEPPAAGIQEDDECVPF